ncbi:hypothetical protein ZWY2020_025693 [Hordeum vulgare]|nr:hypothetical protein ZWY2020_025693 [Hordeum vulgare]
MHARWPKGRADGKGKGRPPKAVVEEEIVAAAEEEGVLREASGASASLACAAVVGGGGGGEATRPSGLSVGLSMVFLLAKTSDEFNKMATVRAEMEALIRDFKGQHAMATANTGGDDDVPGDRNPDSAASSCLSDGNEPQAVTGRCEDHCRRHNHQDTPPFSIGEERDEGGAESSDDDDDDDIAHCWQGLESDLGDDDDGHQDEDHGEEEEDADRYRVSAVELERRLHELLHERNQERIEELEAALRRAEKRLFNKEMEASLWKDTAKMAFRHDHDPDSDSDSP